MSKTILSCTFCHRYTLCPICPSCHQKVVSPHPAKYSPLDKYGNYRRETRKEELQKKGLY
ncbi:nucleolar RNA-binding Nop10p family protein [Candidatus Woesearchaeota archaeon]|nr:nucleolar RNA-binding Nop10p family protein [Candidatus Woesearchaeota archaeon]